MATALNRTDIFSVNYTRIHFLEDLSKVTDVDGVDRLFVPTTMRGSSAGLASKDLSHAAGALFELQTGAKYVDEGKSIAKMRVPIGGSGEEVDIILTNGTFVEVQLGQLTSAEAKKKISRNKIAGAKRSYLSFLRKHKLSQHG